MLQVLIGGALTIVGGFFAAWWQTSRADKVAREIRRDERRERALLELNAEVAQIHASLDSLYRQAESGQTPFQYQEAIKLMGELALHWDTKAAGVIPDQDVLDAYTAVNVAVHNGLPGGSSFARYMATLQSADEQAAQRFVRDLSRILADVGELKKVVQAKIRELSRSTEPHQRKALGIGRALGKGRNRRAI